MFGRCIQILLIQPICEIRQNKTYVNSFCRRVSLNIGYGWPTGQVTLCVGDQVTLCKWPGDTVCGWPGDIVCGWPGDCVCDRWHRVGGQVTLCVGDQVTLCEWPDDTVCGWSGDIVCGWPGDTVLRWPGDTGCRWPGDTGLGWPGDTGCRWPGDTVCGWLGGLHQRNYDGDESACRGREPCDTRPRDHQHFLLYLRGHRPKGCAKCHPNNLCRFATSVGVRCGH